MGGVTGESDEIIFTQKWCGDQVPPIDPGRFDTIVNKTPLTARTNRIILGDAPSVYLERLTRNHGVDSDVLDADVATHLVDPVTLRTDDFDSFFDARQHALLHGISALMGKPLHQVAGDDEFAPEADEPVDVADVT